MVERISDGYFTTLTMRLRRGRDLTADDVAAARRVAVVNERLVELHLKGADPIGRGLSLAGPTTRSLDRPSRRLRDRRRRRRREEPGHHDPDQPEIFVPASMGTSRNSQGLLVKTAARRWRWSGA